MKTAQKKQIRMDFTVPDGLWKEIEAVLPNFELQNTILTLNYKTLF